MDSGSVYGTPDSGGECGVPYESYFPMPTSAKDKPWYSIELASVHFTVISTEHDWSENSEQVKYHTNISLYSCVSSSTNNDASLPIFLKIRSNFFLFSV